MLCMSSLQQISNHVGYTNITFLHVPQVQFSFLNSKYWKSVISKLVLALWTWEANLLPTVLPPDEDFQNQISACWIFIYIYIGKKVNDFPGMSLTKLCLAGNNYSPLGKVWLATSRPGMGKSVTFFTVQLINSRKEVPPRHQQQFIRPFCRSSFSCFQWPGKRFLHSIVTFVSTVCR